MCHCFFFFFNKKFINCDLLSFVKEKERKARRKGKALQNEEASAPYPAEEEEMEGSGASGNEEEAAEDGEGAENSEILITMCQISLRYCFSNHILGDLGWPAKKPEWIRNFNEQNLT